MKPLEPIDHHEGISVYDGSAIRVSRLALELTSKPPGIQLPCWIDCRESLTKIEPHTADAMGWALLLAVEMTLAQKDGDGDE
jgi:hypothetical protein